MTIIFPDRIDRDDAEVWRKFTMFPDLSGEELRQRYWPDAGGSPA